MTIQVTCPACDETFRFRDEAAGKALKCKHCGAVIEVPDDDDNAYKFHREFADRTRDGRKRKVISTSTTFWPAIGLYVLGGISVAYGFYTLFEFLAKGVPVLRDQTPAQHAVASFFTYAFAIGVPICNAISIVGAYALQIRRVYRMAVLGCLLASIPCLSPCIVLGMPFGIWGLVLLFDKDVKRTFD